MTLERAAHVLGKVSGIPGADEGAFNYAAVTASELEQAIRVGYAAVALMQANKVASEWRRRDRPERFKRVQERQADLAAALRGLPLKGE